MDILTEEMATLIVNETAKRTKTNINIMNFNGVIIASFDKRRIGTRRCYRSVETRKPW